MITSAISTGGIALPNCIVGFLLIEIFAVRLGCLPTGRWASPQDLILPVIAFSLYPMALMAATRRPARSIGHRSWGAVVGVPVGMASGWFGRVADCVSLRAFEVFTMVPPILLALLVIALFGSGVGKLTVFVRVALWVGFARRTIAGEIPSALRPPAGPSSPALVDRRRTHTSRTR